MQCNLTVDTNVWELWVHSSQISPPPEFDDQEGLPQRIVLAQGVVVDNLESYVADNWPAHVTARKDHLVLGITSETVLVLDIPNKLLVDLLLRDHIELLLSVVQGYLADLDYVIKLYGAWRVM